MKKIAGHLGKEMTKQTFARTVSKAVPVVGAVVSGGLTFATFRPMAKKLKNHLAELDMTKPTLRVEDVEVVLEREPSATDYVEQSDGDDAASK